jgi:hypothetical protein
VADPGWRDLFADVVVQHVVSSRLDHCPILVELRKDCWDRKGSRLFRYEVMWERVDSLSLVIRNEWNNLSDMGSLGGLVRVLDNMQKTLSQWSKHHFCSVTTELNKLRKELEEAQAQPSVNREACRAIKDQMDELLYQEEMMWLQRSRVSWLRKGDRNTKYFHQHAKWRARKNKIRKLQRSDESWCDNPREMQDMAHQYFGDLFSMDREVAPDHVLNLVEQMVTPTMNQHLCEAFTEKEISDAMFQMGPLKAPGLDGFPARFYQRNWLVVKHDVIASV